MNQIIRNSSKWFRLLSFFLLLPYSAGLFAQDLSVLQGRITDRKNGEPLAGATIILDDTIGISSDANGFYFLQLQPGDHTLSCQFVGYKPEKKQIHINPSDTVSSDIQLEVSIEILEEIVVTAGKFDQKLSDVTVSMEVIKPVMIRRNNDITMESVIHKIPGVDVLDGQPSIRGGSGFSYGAGSRVLVLVDDLPILSADVGDVKWDYLPVENVSSVEILKGASSVLYGSSALNGVINVRTAFPQPDPETSLTLFTGIYMNPSRAELKWWKSPPLFYGTNFLHMRKIRKMDLVAGGNLFHNPGYRENEWDTWGRGNLKIGVTSRKVQGLSYGLNTSFMLQDKSDFLLWLNADSGGYRQNPDAITALKGSRLNIDPYISFHRSENSTHSLKTRFFRVENVFKEDSDKDNRSSYYFGEYRYLKKTEGGLHWSLGTSAGYSNIVANLYGNHYGSNLAIFTQLDGRFFERLKWSAGIRWETSGLDQERIHSKPVFRTGLNLQLAEYTYIRMSAGQGYRFPSVAEKYTATTISSLQIFPNPDLKPENGWSAEFGVKQGLTIGSWKGFMDVAAFWTEYHDMIEFTFGVYKPDSVEIPTFEHIGFKSLNVGKARINGIEVSINLEGKLGSATTFLSAGYTFMNPIDLQKDKNDTTSSGNNNYLKYRYRHSFKGDVHLTWRKLSAGINMIYQSYMLNVDQVFVDPVIGALILPGYAEYRAEHDKGFLVLDHRISYNLFQKMKLSIITKNLLNKEYIGRPGDIGPPRNITLQFSSRF